MDRKKKDELPKMQVGFIDSICMPLYKVLATLVPDLVPLLEGVKNNRNNWQALADNPKGTKLIFFVSFEFSYIHLQLMSLNQNHQSFHLRE